MSRKEGPGAYYAGFRLFEFNQYQGGEKKIKTPEDVEKVLELCSWIIFTINRNNGNWDTTQYSKTENGPSFIGPRILKEDVQKFMENKKFERINPKAYFRRVKKDKLLPTVREWEEQLHKKELELINEKITFEIFKIFVDNFDRSVSQLGFEGYYYLAREDETIEIFHQNGFFATKVRGCGWKRDLSNFKKEEKKTFSSKSLKITKYTPPQELLEGDFRDLEIDGKIIWGIGPKAITLVDNVGYNHEYHHSRYPIGKKKFINYERNPIKAKELAEKILNKYGE